MSNVILSYSIIEYIRAIIIPVLGAVIDLKYGTIHVSRYLYLFGSRTKSFCLIYQKLFDWRLFSFGLFLMRPPRLYNSQLVSIAHCCGAVIVSLVFRKQSTSQDDYPNKIIIILSMFGSCTEGVTLIYRHLFQLYEGETRVGRVIINHDCNLMLCCWAFVVR